MFNLKVIDAHAHIYPEKIASRAVSAVKDFYEIGFKDANSGTLNDLACLMDKANVVKCVVSPVATVPHQVVSANNFMAESAKADSRLIPFATLHPEMTKLELREEISRIKSLGLKGIKLHPDFQRFALNGENAYKIFNELSGDTPILLHTGDKRYNFSSPLKAIAVAKDFKHLKFIGAHFGGYSEWEHIKGYAETENVFFDTSSSLPFLTPKEVKEIFSILGIQRFMFGTDYPMWNYDSEKPLIERLELSQAELELILYKNAERILYESAHNAQRTAHND
ncbi:MAG: amidohydrolase family protein [Firmicutes bacterium]|nr:amidohydrolase family protein [Bacillota bacterium]